MVQKKSILSWHMIFSVFFIFLKSVHYNVIIDYYYNSQMERNCASSNMIVLNRIGGQALHPPNYIYHGLYI